MQEELKNDILELYHRLSSDNNTDINKIVNKEWTKIKNIYNNNELLEKLDLQDEIKEKRESNIYYEIESIKEKEKEKNN